MLAAVAEAVVEMDGACRLLGQAPAQHAHHRRDADAAGDEDGRDAGIGVDEELPGRSPDPENIALVDLIVEVGGAGARRQLRVVGRWRHALDGDAIARRVRSVGQGVAAGDRALLSGSVSATRRSKVRNWPGLNGGSGAPSMGSRWNEHCVRASSSNPRRATRNSRQPAQAPDAVVGATPAAASGSAAASPRRRHTATPIPTTSWSSSAAQM